LKKRVPIRGHWNDGKWVPPYVQMRNSSKEDGGSGGGNSGGGGVWIAATATAVVGVTAVTIGITGGDLFRSKSTRHSRSPDKSFSMQAQAGFRRTEAALTASNFKANLVMKLDTNCAVNSYGKVQKFFQSHPCESLARAYIQTGELDQGSILVAIAWVEMPNTTLAETYKHLVDRRDSGNVTELSHETKLYKLISYSGSVYASGIYGNAVWNVEIKPVFPTAVDMLNKVTADSRQ